MKRGGPAFTHDEPMEMRQQKAADRARDRLNDRGVAATDFRSGLIAWNPPSVGFSGELELTHSLGRVPSGVLLIAKNLELSFSTYEKSSWTDRKLKLWIDAYHDWERFQAVIATNTDEITHTLVRQRSSAAGLGAEFGLYSGTPGDHAPVTGTAFSISGGVWVSYSFGYSDNTNRAWQTNVIGTLRTTLIPDDEFVWLVI